MFILFGVFILLGQLFFSLGCSFKSISFMIFGRIVFGLGGEAINASQSTLIVNWFHPNELSFALGITLSILRFGSVINDIISPIIATHNKDVSISLWIGFSICALSFLISLLVIYIDWRQDILIQMKQIVDSKNGTVKIEEESTKNSMSNLSDFPRLVFMLCALCTLLYSGIFPFNYIATGFLISTWYNALPPVEAQHKAGFAMGLPFLFSAFIIPIIGIYVDRYGKRTYLLILSCICGISSFIFFIFINPIFPLLLLGLCYGLFSSIIWPALSIIVGKELTGFIIGFTVSLQNTGLVISPLIVATIYTKTNSYFVTLSFFLVIMSASLILSIFIHFEDKKNNNILNSSSEKNHSKEVNKFKYDVINSIDVDDKNSIKGDSVVNVTAISTKFAVK